MNKKNVKWIFLILCIGLLSITFTSCDFSPVGHLSDEEELVNNGYVLLELDEVSNIWYKNVSSTVTRYIQQDEISHYLSYYLDIYFYIEVDSTNNSPSLVIKSKTETALSSEAFLPNYAFFQSSSQHSTFNVGKVPIIWGDIVYNRYYSSYDYKYNLWCESSVLNDSDSNLNNLIDLLDSEEDIYFYFDNDIVRTHLKSLSANFQTRIRDTLYTYVNYKDELIFRNQ